MSILTIYLLIINLLAYTIMWIDKFKSIYKWWRVPEKNLWIFALIGGVFGIWLGMQTPLYHKAGKRSFKVWIPMIAVVWLILWIYAEVGIQNFSIHL